MDGAHSDKLMIGNAEDVLGTLVKGGWLVRVSTPGDDDDDVDVDFVDGDDGDDDGAVGGGSIDGEAREEKEEDNHNNRKKKRRSSFKGTYYGIGSQSFVELDEFWSSLFSNKSKNPRQHIQQSNGPLHPATPLHCLVQHPALPSTSLAMRCAWRFVSFERGRGRWTDVMGLEYGVQWWVLFLVL